MKRLLLIALLAVPVLAQENQHIDTTKPLAGAASYFRDLKLVDQDGKTVDLYKDLMDGKIVVINSFFATCHGSCPILSAAMNNIEKTFGSETAKKLSLVSITVDPENDTPAKLKEYAKQLKAAPNWRFLTGTKAQVDAALGKLGMAVANREAHQNLIIVGNIPTGLWKKVLGIAKADDVIKAVRGVVEDPGAPAAASR